MTNVIINKSRAERIAKTLCPVIIQEWEDIKDFPTEIMLDEPKNQEGNLLWAIAKPAVYYRAFEDEDYFYCYYMLFHPLDWSDFSIPFIRKLDEHTYDTEGMCVRLNKLTGQRDLATIFHYRLRKEEDIEECDSKVWVEAEGHGIRPYKSRYQEKSKNPYSVYNNKSLIFHNFQNWIDNGAYEFFTEVVNSEGVNASHQHPADGGKLFTDPGKKFKEIF